MSALTFSLHILQEQEKCMFLYIFTCPSTNIVYHTYICASQGNWYLNLCQNEVSVKTKLKQENSNKISISQKDGKLSSEFVNLSQKIKIIDNSYIEICETISL